MSVDPRIIAAHTDEDGNVQRPLVVGNNGEIDYDEESKVEMAMRRYEMGLEVG
jgi:hypothetical protein